MKIDNVNVKAVCSIDVNEFEAFRILCKTLDMDFVYNDDRKFIIKKDEEEDTNFVYLVENGEETLYDERGDLFVALRNVAVNICPNVEFRGDSYIYGNS